ncbi:MAG: SDR family NAD(P)-dependent oxidoreductase [Actinomycetota bacterium]
MNVLVTGGSRGLGLELSRHLLERGHHLRSFARSETAEARELAERFPDRYAFTAVDATDYAALEAFVSAAKSAWGSIDALVNNAAVGQDSLFVHTSPDQIRQIVRTNVEAPLLLTRLVIRQMLRQEGTGFVVNIGSISATEGYAGLSVYAATKGAIEAFTRSLARELAGRVRINTLAPGFFDSEMSNVLLPEQRDAIMRRTPTGRLTTPGDLTAVVELLLREDGNLNGTVIAVDGGASA